MFHPLYYRFFQCYHAGLYWEAHEVLEELWQTRRQDDFYHGLIQVAALMHQLKRGKVRGARKLATTAVGYLGPFSPEKDGVNVEAVLRWLEECLNLLPDGPRIITPAEVEALGIGICPLPCFSAESVEE
ncbi:putative metal-dependent hydrolase [Kroppenstedtia sanguinis]|uniref:DUF309 domain-containing protein n=1 Tax=Kroppenstedtia sanguinis TaxID=1380684 RepID=A0ABW4CBN1_9BACL